MAEPTVPVDEDALVAIEHALGAFEVHTEDGVAPEIIGAEYTLPQLLDFWTGDDLGPDDDPLEDYDVIRALIAEVRRLRGAPVPNGTTSEPRCRLHNEPWETCDQRHFGEQPDGTTSERSEA